MIKKILIALAMTFATIAPVALTASPAEAYTCSYKYKTATKDVYAGSFPFGHYAQSVRLDYRVCNEPNTRVCDETHCYNLFSTTAYADRYTVTNRNVSGTCRGVDSWSWNPNAIGNIDLVAKTRGCYGTGSYQIIEWDFANQRITQGMSDAASCLGANVTALSNSLPDETTALPSLCVTFTM